MRNLMKQANFLIILILGTPLWRLAAFIEFLHLTLPETKFPRGFSPKKKELFLKNLNENLLSYSKLKVPAFKIYDWYK